MDIILLQDIDKVGYKHEVVTVKNGYGRNYLIPQKMAIIANATNLKKLEEIKEKEAAALAARISEFQAIADQLEGKVLKIGAKAGQSGKIFGSVTNIQIANALKEQLDIDVERRIIEMPEEVKMLGEYVAKLNMHKEVEASIAFEVVEE
ncbi:MAG: 50S ribosomal protein L9 [Bacteroidota bacterium]